MVRIFFLLLVISPFSLSAQKDKQGTKVLLGFNFSPDRSFRTLHNDGGGTGGDLVINSRNDTEIPRPGFTTGLTILVQVSPKIILESGLQVSSKGYKTKEMNLDYFPPNPAAPIKAMGTYRYHYLGFPLRAKFVFGKPSIRFMPGIGLMTNFLLNTDSKFKYTYSDGRTEELTESMNSEFKMLDISPILSFGVDFKLSPRFHLLAEPTFRYGLMATRDESVKENLWSAGVNVGFFYRL